MISPVIASATLLAVALVVVASQQYFTRLRWRKEDEEIAARRQKYAEEAEARWARAVAPLQLPEWKPWQPDPRESEERLQRALAAMDAAAHDPELEQMLEQFWAARGKPAEPPASAVPVDLSELPERLSEAGYVGGPLRLAAVECLAANHVVVHLESRKG